MHESRMRWHTPDARSTRVRQAPPRPRMPRCLCAERTEEEPPQRRKKCTPAAAGSCRHAVRFRAPRAAFRPPSGCRDVVPPRVREKRRVRAWHDVAHRIHYLKEFVLDALYSGAACRMRVCFMRWHHAVLLVIRVLELQRLARGFLGRLDARWIWRIHELVTAVQAKVRKFLVLTATRKELRLSLIHI